MGAWRSFAFFFATGPDDSDSDESDSDESDSDEADSDESDADESNSDESDSDESDGGHDHVIRCASGGIPRLLAVFPKRFGVLQHISYLLHRGVVEIS